MSSNEIATVASTTPIGLCFEAVFYGAYSLSLFRHIHALKTLSPVSSRLRCAALISLLYLYTAASADLFLRFSDFYNSRTSDVLFVSVLSLYTFVSIFLLPLSSFLYMSARQLSKASAREGVILTLHLTVVGVNITALTTFPALQSSLDADSTRLFFKLLPLSLLALLELVQLGLVGATFVGLGLHDALRLPRPICASACRFIVSLFEQGRACSILVVTVLASLLVPSSGSLAPLLSGSCLQTACMAVSALVVRMVMLRSELTSDSSKRARAEGAALLSVVVGHGDKKEVGNKGSEDDKMQVV